MNDWTLQEQEDYLFQLIEACSTSSDCRCKYAPDTGGATRRVVILSDSQGLRQLSRARREIQATEGIGLIGSALCGTGWGGPKGQDEPAEITATRSDIAAVC